MSEPKTATQVAAKPGSSPSGFIWGLGRRKKAVARVRIKPGEGKIIINKKELSDFFPVERDQTAVRAPLTVTESSGAWDVFVNVQGGGTTGQAGAISLGLARALAESNADLEHALRDHGMLTRDSRMKERKKPGQKGARKAFQFSKR